MTKSMAQNEVSRFEDFLQADDKARKGLDNLVTYSEVTAYAKTVGYNFTEEELSNFLKSNVSNLPNDVLKKIVREGQIDFTEESIVQFSATRLQVDTDY